MQNGFSFLFLILLIIGSFHVGLAEQGLNLEIKSSLGSISESPSLYLKTKDNRSGQIVFSGADTFDAFFESNNYNQALLLRSMVTNDPAKLFFLDTWDAILHKERTIEMRFQVLQGANATGQLVLSWDKDSLRDPDLRGRYFFTLKDYGNDSTFSSLAGTTLMHQDSSYSFWNTFSTRYFKIETDYKYCGDSVKQSWEACDGSIGSETCISVNPAVYSGGNLGCSASCTWDTSACISSYYCGDGIITKGGGFDEECDLTNLDGKSCTSFGYVSGTLRCVAPNLTHQCKIDKSGCIAADGSSGSSPGGGGASIGCTPECVLGQRRCIENDTYQVCGVFGSNSCARWGNVDKCLGVNPHCKNGFCFGCFKDSDCKDGWCVNGKCETDCGKSCSDLGLKCGKKEICGVMLDCGSCSKNLFCNRGNCSKLPEDAIKISDKECSAEYICSPWSECKVSFESKELLLGESWFSGKRNRLCFDSNECYSTVKEQEVCELKVEISSRETEICGVKYIEIFDKKTNKLLARTRDLRYQLARAIEIFLLPGEINCETEELAFELSWFDRVMFILDLKRIWRFV